MTQRWGLVDYGGFCSIDKLDDGKFVLYEDHLAEVAQIREKHFHALGDYVLYEDHLISVDKKKREIENLKAELKKINIMFLNACGEIYFGSHTEKETPEEKP